MLPFGARTDEVILIEAIPVVTTLSKAPVIELHPSG